VAVVSKDADFDERFVITGSDATDGAHVAVPGVTLSVSGAGWTLDFEWNDNAGSGWQPSDVRRTARYTTAEGLVVDLGIDDNLPALRDGDFNDVVVSCRSDDPAHTPLHPVVIPYDFTVPKEVLEKWSSHQRGQTGDRRHKDERKPG
jgi:hypothetical protein